MVNEDGYDDLSVTVGNTVYLLLGDNLPYDALAVDQISAELFTPSTRCIAEGALHPQRGALHPEAGQDETSGESEAVGSSRDATHSSRCNAPSFAAPIGDANGDLIDDFAIIDGTQISIYQGDDDWSGDSLANVRATYLLNTVNAAGTVEQVVSLGDATGDGVDDFAMLANGSVTVVGGNGQAQTATAALPTTPASITAVQDIDNDGLGDLLILGADENGYLIRGGALDTIEATIEGDWCCGGEFVHGGGLIWRGMVRPISSSSPPTPPRPIWAMTVHLLDAP